MFCVCVCVCVCVGVLRPGFMHERAHTLDWAEKIPEIMQLIPLSCCYSGQIKMFCTVSVTPVLTFRRSPRWPISSRSTNPRPQVPSASAGRTSIDSVSNTRRWQGQKRRLHSVVQSGETCKDLVQVVAVITFTVFTLNFSHELQSDSSRRVCSNWSRLWCRGGFACPRSQLNPRCRDFFFSHRLDVQSVAASLKFFTGASFGIQAAVQMNWWHAARPPPPSSEAICPSCLRPPLPSPALCTETLCCCCCCKCHSISEG